MVTAIVLVGPAPVYVSPVGPLMRRRRNKVSNSEMEMRWVDAWNALYDIVGDRSDVPCQLPDWSLIDVEACRGWLQESVYAGYHVRVEEGWVGHRRGSVMHRWLGTDA